MWNVGVILVLVCRLGGLYTEMFNTSPTHSTHTLNTLWAQKLPLLPRPLFGFRAVRKMKLRKAANC